MLSTVVKLSAGGNGVLEERSQLTGSPQIGSFGPREVELHTLCATLAR